MNILYYCEEYPPARNGGIGAVVKVVAEAMAQRGHRVYVVGKYWDGKGLETIENINGVNVIRWHKGSYNTLGIRCCDFIHSAKNRQRKSRRILYRTHQLIERAITNYHIDVLEMPDYVDDFMSNDHSDMEQKCFSIPMIIRVHGSVSFLCYYLKKETSQGYRIIQDQGHISRADAICAVSEFSKSFVKKYLCPEKEVEVIYNPIDDALFESTKNDAVGTSTILFFGKIAKMKGVFSLIKAFNMVASTHPEVRLKLVGNGNISKVKQMVDPRFACRVEFVGFIPHDRIFDEIDSASFCVLPSYFETFSMAAVEVLARRKALIFTSKATGPELIEDGNSGLLVDPDNIEQLAEKMNLLLDDIEMRDRIALNGYEMCRRRFSTKVIVPQMEQYYQNVIQRCRE